VRTRPLPLTIAAVLLALFSLANLLSPVMPTEGVPAFVAYLGVALGLALFAAARLWTLERVGCVAHHRLGRAKHPLGGSGDGLRAERRAAGARYGYGSRLRLGHLARGAAGFAAGLHLTLGLGPNRAGRRRGNGAQWGIMGTLAT
jgi:hypothetical protein